MDKKNKLSNNASRGRQFKRALWKHLVRWLGLIIVACLNFSLIASNLRLRSAQRMDLRHELASYLLLVFLDIVFLLPTIFEVNNITVTSEALILNTLLWQSRLLWSRIESCNKPAWLAYAIVKTKGCFYLINKRDIAEFDELLELIRLQLAKAHPGSAGE